MTEEVPIMPEIKLPASANSQSETPEKAAEWLIHNQEAPPVPPPIYEWSPQLKSKIEKELADKPEVYFDRRRETLENSKPQETPASGMVPLKEVLAKYPTNQPLQSGPIAQTPQASTQTIYQSAIAVLTNTTYRRPMIIGAGSGMVIMLVLLVLQVF